MRILMLCTKYGLEVGDEYLTNDLASAFVSQGHVVQVVLLDWTASYGTPTASYLSQDGIDVLVIAPRALRGISGLFEKVSKWAFSSVFAAIEMRGALKGGKFDLLIAFSPAVTVAAHALWAMRHFRTRNYLVIWDFFPYHHESIGLIPPGAMFQITWRLEQLLIRRFHVIGCMSPKNVSYLRSHYRLRAAQDVQILPIWGRTTPLEVASKSELRAIHGLPPDKKIAVFGGQITEGRGIEDILAAAKILREKSRDVIFLLIGQGRLTKLIRDYTDSGGMNVIFRERIPRKDYLNVITACDVGLVCTVRDVDVPTFPSKTIDYLRAGLPVIASVEQATDYGQFIENQGIGYAVPAGDPCALASAIDSLVDDAVASTRMSRAGRRALDEIFDVALAAQCIIKAVSKNSQT